MDSSRSEFMRRPISKDSADFNKPQKPNNAAFASFSDVRKSYEPLSKHQSCGNTSLL